MEALWDRIEELAMDKSGSGKLVPVEDAGLAEERVSPA